MKQVRFGSFWHGGPLRRLEQICAKTFLSKGQDLVVYSYTPDLLNAAPEIEVIDASSVFQLDTKFERLLNDNPVRFSDFFRLLMIRETNRTWVDLDVFYIKDFEFETNLLAYERYIHGAFREVINCVLYIDPDSDLFADYLGLFLTDKISLREDWKAAAVTGDYYSTAFQPLANNSDVNVFSPELQRNFFGPILLTLLAREHAITEIQPRNVHCAYGGPKLKKNTMSPDRLNLSIPKEAQSIHLFGSVMRRILTKMIRMSGQSAIKLPEGCLLHQAQLQAGFSELDWRLEDI